MPRARAKMKYKTIWELNGEEITSHVRKSSAALIAEYNEVRDDFVIELYASGGSEKAKRLSLRLKELDVAVDRHVKNLVCWAETRLNTGFTGGVVARGHIDGADAKAFIFSPGIGVLNFVYDSKEKAVDATVQSAVIGKSDDSMLSIMARTDVSRGDFRMHYVAVGHGTIEDVIKSDPDLCNLPHRFEEWTWNGCTVPARERALNLILGDKFPFEEAEDGSYRIESLQNGPVAVDKHGRRII